MIMFSYESGRDCSVLYTDLTFHTKKQDISSTVTEEYTASDVLVFT